MSGYIPISTERRQEMLAKVGVDLDRLFDSIPQELRSKLHEQELKNLPENGWSEQAIAKHIQSLAELNCDLSHYDSYLGAGIYDHYRPSAISALIQRQEYLTSYTPYQAEISQGTLQAIFEWQTYICRLTGMDIANSSMYDGASAAAEALLMACRQTGRHKVWVSGGVNPETRETIATYFYAGGLEVEFGDLNTDLTSEDTYPDAVEEYAGLLVQSPNYYGVVEDLTAFAEYAHTGKSLAVVSTDPISLAILRDPGSCNCDIVCGEAQPLGIATNFGGPAVGYLAATKKLLRKMPGRICGETVDRDGNRAYVLTIQAREQHIRREKATSNICTSQALLATAATIYMALLGRSGITEVAENSQHKALYLQRALISTGLFKAVSDRPFFREFTLMSDCLDLHALNRYLLEQKIIGGVIEGDKYILAVTEQKDKQALDRLVHAVQDFAERMES